MKRFSTGFLLLSILHSPFAEAQGELRLSAPRWSVEHIVNNSLTVLEVDQLYAPRNNRAVALSADGRFLYLGYGEPGWYVRKVEIGRAPGDNLTSVKAQLALTDEGRGLNWAKAAATDDAGRVYLTRDLEIHVYDADLTARLLIITGFHKTNGVHVVREGPGSLLLYHTERDATSGQLGRMVLNDTSDFAGGTRAWAGDPRFGSGGLTDLGAVATDVRGLAADAEGDVWAAETSGTLFRISSTGRIVSTVLVPEPFDVFVDGNQVFVSEAGLATVAIVDRTSLEVRTLRIPFASLGLTNAYEPPPDYAGMLTGIDGRAGVGCFIANEGGESIAPSPFGGGQEDDDDPVLRARPSPDFDQDGDVDLEDFVAFTRCFNGPNNPVASSCLNDADLDSDGDADLEDFKVLQHCFNGPNRLPTCD